MRKTENLALIIVLMLLAACNTPLTISKADFGESTSSVPPGRLVYHLPKTVVNIEVTARKITEKRGPYYRYSERYLNLSDIIKEDNEYWEIVEARIYTSGIPAPNRIYSIAAEGTPAGAALNLTPDGILQGFNMPADVSFPSPVGASSQTSSYKSEEISFDDIPFTEEQLIKTSSAATAEEVAAEIYNIRDSRRRLLEGDVKNLPPDEGSYQRILEGLNNMEKQYLSLFKGKRQTETRKQVFSFVPEANEAANQVLFRFSGQKGFTQIDDMTGTPVYIEVISEEVTDFPGIQSNPKERTGMIYCKPGKATVKVIDRTKQLTEKEILIGQFGSLHTMPPSLLDSPNTRVGMDPSTGAILNISVQE
ncbi:DUF4831 family protein [Marinilabilia salmonicolor]|uniref:DUF4831 family protein n=1 Tax=Marinilabilia salmonicolor TaxID=989 RepID=UPI00029B051B|nr:DUF4831 family protein [Marinilabilia salmonicolor]